MFNTCLLLMPMALLLVGCGGDGQGGLSGGTEARPNILLIVADDLGYTDLGIYGSEINTPVLDRLARSGVMFTRFHNATLCSPTRAMLLSGTDHHLAGTTHPGTSYHGRRIYPLEGKSMLAMLTGKADRVHGQDDRMAWEIFDRRAVIQGDWKLLLMEPPWGTGEWQLYNLETDPAEQADLAAQYPELVERMGAYWERYRTRVGVVPMQGGTKF